MIALSVAKLNMFSPESEIFLWIKAKKFLLKVWINGDVKKYAKGQEMYFVMNRRLSNHKVLHYIASLSGFFRFRSDFLAFYAPISYFKFLGFKELNKTIIPFALVGYETGYSQLGATRLVGYLPSHIQLALME